MGKFKSSRLLPLLVALFLFIQNAHAQSAVTGTVTDKNGKGIPGVTVNVKGTATATQTDEGGKFSIAAPGYCHSGIHFCWIYHNRNPYRRADRYSNITGNSGSEFE